MLQLIRYQEEMHKIWDRFLDSAVNAHFFFCRKYFLHQKQKFNDHSIIVFEGENPVALLPGVEISPTPESKEWHSHAGLSFGGLVQAPHIGMSAVLEIFSLLKMYLSNQHFTKVIYRAMPHIYYTVPSLEDRYALFTQGARLLYTQPYSVLPPGTYGGLSKRQKTRIRSIMRANDLTFSTITSSSDLERFYIGLKDNLKTKYGVSPVHSLKELKQLSEFFPENIVFYCLRDRVNILSGVVLFINKTTVHTQYLFNTPEGQEIDGLMILLDKLIATHNSVKHFSFGISTEQNGLVLNEGLIRFKEKFSAHAICQDCYEWPIRETFR
ncbi:hypothetical protein CHISP_1592 [Chitinispirillum alkaliphilum]|nr:hypothetical protein CHISP_1592 [Chitinispirillum alkaliphilum]